MLIKKIGSLRKEIEHDIQVQLSPEQRSRLQQILFQSLGPHTILVSDSAREAVALTPEQLKKLERIEEEIAKSQNFSQLMFSSQAHEALFEELLCTSSTPKLRASKVQGSISSRSALVGQVDLGFSDDSSCALIAILRVRMNGC